MLLPPLPQIAGLDLICRGYSGAADLADIDRVRAAVLAVEPRTGMPGPDTNNEAPFTPFCLIGSLDGSAVAYTWMNRWAEADGTRLWLLGGWVDPCARGRGIGRALLAWQERAALAHAVHEHGRVPQKAMLGANAGEDQATARELLLASGYRVAFTVVSMACGTARRDGAALPHGLIERPVQPDMHRRIHAAIEESFQHSRNGHTPRTFEKYLHDVQTRQHDTSLWCVTWDGDEVAGLVIAGKSGGGVELPWVAVRAAWRRRGLAQAMLRTVISRCATAGVPSIALETVEENENRTVGLYQSVGFKVIRRNPRYRKPMPREDNPSADSNP